MGLSSVGERTWGRVGGAGPGSTQDDVLNVGHIFFFFQLGASAPWAQKKRNTCTKAYVISL